MVLRGFLLSLLPPGADRLTPAQLPLIPPRMSVDAPLIGQWSVADNLPAPCLVVSPQGERGTPPSLQQRHTPLTHLDPLRDPAEAPERHHLYLGPDTARSPSFSAGKRSSRSQPSLGMVGGEGSRRGDRADGQTGESGQAVSDLFPFSGVGDLVFLLTLHAPE